MHFARGENHGEEKKAYSRVFQGHDCLQKASFDALPVLRKEEV